jgi:hypothetical protein
MNFPLMENGMKQPRRLVPCIDPADGERYDVDLPRANRPRHKGPFFMLQIESEAMDNVLQKRLPATTLQVLLYALTHAQRNNVLPLRTGVTAQACAITQAQASLAIKRLREERYIAPITDAYGTKGYMINPDFGWNGTPADYQAGVLLWEELKTTDKPKRKAKIHLRLAHTNA